MAKRRAAYVLGLDQFERKIQRLAERLDDRTVDEALFDGGMVILVDAQSRIDDVTGVTRESGYVTTPSKNNYQAGKRRNKMKKAPKRTAMVRFAARTAHILEYGSAPHSYRRRRARALQTTQTQFAASVDHPGARAKPFLRPAYDAKRDDVVRVVADRLERAVKEAARG